MKPRLLIFRSLWTNGFSLPEALDDVASGRFDGLEGPIPSELPKRREFIARLKEADIPFVAEIVTGGNYVPVERTPAAHLDAFARQLDLAASAKPRFATVLFGCDAWGVGATVECLGRALDLAAERDLPASFETHRSRPTFNPWVTAELLRQLPALELTCDFSHWCCVCERLVLDDEPELLAFIAARARHIHGRVGYAQGPQVPHPAAPEYRTELLAHERWWNAIFDAQVESGREELTLTPEFGPDGYLHAEPFFGREAANLDEVNRWMATRQRERFALRQPALAIGGRN